MTTRPDTAASIGAKIRRYRQERGWTQTELAERAFGEASRQSDVSKWELGKSTPDMETLQRIADALGVPLAAFGPSPEPSDDVKALRWHLRQMLEILDRMG